MREREGRVTGHYHSSPVFTRTQDWICAVFMAQLEIFRNIFNDIRVRNCADQGGEERPEVRIASMVFKYIYYRENIKHISIQ